jgi:hypothetical protein
MHTAQYIKNIKDQMVFKFAAKNPFQDPSIGYGNHVNHLEYQYCSPLR